MPARLAPLSCITVTAALALAGCGSGVSSDNGGSGAVSVRAGDSSCDVAKAAFDGAGQVRFDVQNTGQDVTEVYVYAKGSSGDFDKVVGEVENIAPGTRRDVTVDLPGGKFEVACKPGQKGDGIRTTITVAGKAAEAKSAYDREVQIAASDYEFGGLDGFTAKGGEKIEFKLQNTSETEQHEFEVFGPDGQALGEVGPTDPGAEGEVVLEFSAPGTYRYECGIADHADRGMTGTFDVS